MIIEYFGISGVGKTTIAKKDYKQKKLIWPRYDLYENKNWLFRNIKKSSYVFYMIFTNHKWIKTFKKTINEINIKKEKDKYVVLFNGISLKYMLKKIENKKEKYLFDEGVFQFIWAVYLRTEDEPQLKFIENILELFGAPEQLNIITAESEIIKKRLINRGRQTKILEDKNLLKKINLMQKRMEQIITLASNKLNSKKTIINYIDNSKEM